jgi:hypothetical protein
MPEIAADPSAVCCSSLLSGSETEEIQSLAPDPFSLRAPARAREADRGAREPSARDDRGRFAQGHSGNPQGRPRGIPNPKRRVLTVQAWRRNPQAASALLDRKPRLLLPLLRPVLPPASARRVDPAERLGISVASLRTAAEMQQALTAVWAAVSQGEIAPAEAGRIARRVRTRLRALRRLARLQRRLARLAQKTDPGRPPLG